MGYEYDFVFDWMVKKPTPHPQIKNNDEEAKDEDKGGDASKGAAAGEVP